MNIVCLKWGDKYGPEYVNRLYSGVNRNCSIPFKFICFTDNDHGLNTNIQTIPIDSSSLPVNQRGFQGWWFKLHLFENNNGLNGRVVYIDLDTVITGNIDHILQNTQGFVTLRDFYRGYPPNQPPRDEVGSGLLAWDHNEHDYFYSEFMPSAEKLMPRYPGGDQMWIQDRQQERTYWQDHFPNQIVSFKAHCVPHRSRAKVSSKLPHDARIVCFHGPPRPHEVAHHDWMKQHWID